MEEFYNIQLTPRPALVVISRIVYRGRVLWKTMGDFEEILLYIYIFENTVLRWNNQILNALATSSYYSSENTYNVNNRTPAKKNDNKRIIVLVFWYANWECVERTCSWYLFMWIMDYEKWILLVFGCLQRVHVSYQLSCIYAISIVQSFNTIRWEWALSMMTNTNLLTSNCLHVLASTSNWRLTKFIILKRKI